MRKPGFGANPEGAVLRRQQETYRNFLGFPGAQANLGEVLPIKPGQSAVGSYPKESIRGLGDGVYFVVGQALFYSEIGSQITACLGIKRQGPAHE
jgi:hypothetical protein